MDNTKIKSTIVKLLCDKLNIVAGQCFKFANQKTKDEYFFSQTNLMKICYDPDETKKQIMPSHVSLNWLLNDKCKVNVIKSHNAEELVQPSQV